MTHEEKWKGFAELYALDALDKKDRRAFETHLSDGCTECAITFHETRGLLGILPHALTPVSPSPAVKATLMAKIALETDASAAGWPALRRPLVWTALGTLALAAVFFWLTMAQPQKQPQSAAKNQSIHSDELTHLLSGENVKMLPIEDQHSGGALYGKLVWNFRHCGGCLLLNKLAKIPEDKVFQLWGINDEQRPVSIGVFTADSLGNAHVDFNAMQHPENFITFKITVEDRGGALAPTTTPLLQARL